MDLESWLRQEKIYHCYEILKEAGVEEPEDLCELTENDLAGMLNWNVLTRRRIVNAITKMKGLTPEPSLLEIVRARSPVKRPRMNGRGRSPEKPASSTKSISLSDVDRVDVKAVKASAASKQQYNQSWNRNSPSGQGYNGNNYEDTKTAASRDVNEARSDGKDLDGVFDQVQKEWLENSASNSSLDKKRRKSPVERNSTEFPVERNSTEFPESKPQVRPKTEAVLDPFSAASGEFDEKEYHSGRKQRSPPREQRSPAKDSGSPLNTSFVSAKDVHQTRSKRAMESGFFDEADFLDARKDSNQGVDQKQDHSSPRKETGRMKSLNEENRNSTVDQRKPLQQIKPETYDENFEMKMGYVSNEQDQDSFNFDQDLQCIPHLPSITDLGEVVDYLVNLTDCQEPRVRSEVQPRITDIVNPIKKKCSPEFRDLLTGGKGRKKQKQILAQFLNELAIERRKLEDYLRAFLEEENPFGDQQALFQEEQEANEILMSYKDYVENFDAFVDDHNHSKLLLASITGETMKQMMSLKNPPKPVMDMINAMEKFKKEEIALRAITEASARKEKVKKKLNIVQRVEEFIENVREQLVFDIELIKACERILEGELDAKKLEEQMRKCPDIGDTKLPLAYVKPYTDTCKKVQRRYSNISQAKLETTFKVLKKYFVLLVRLYKTYAGLEGKLGQGLAGMSSLMWGVCTQALELPMTTDDDEQNYMHDIFDQCTVLDLESDEKANFSDDEGAQPWGLNGQWRCENHLWTLQQNYVDMFSGYIQNENYALIEGTVNDDEIMNFSVHWQSVSEKPGLVARCKGAYSEDMLDIRVRFKTNTGESGIWELTKAAKVKRQPKGGSSTLKYDAFILAILWVALYVSPKKEPWDALEYLVEQHIIPKALSKWNVDPKDQGAVQVLEKKKHKKTLGSIFRHYAHDRKDSRKGKLLTYAKWEELCKDLMRAATRSGLNFERPSLRVQQFAFYTSKRLFSTSQVGTLKQLTHSEFLDAVVRLAYKMVHMENLKKGRRKSLRKLELSELNFGPIGDKTSVVVKWLADVAKYHR